MKEPDKKRRKLLVTVGILMLLVFLASATINSVAIYLNFTRFHVEKMQKQARQMTSHLRNVMEEYEALPWLTEYWETHYEEMDIPPGGLSDSKWRNSHDTFFKTNVKKISIEEANAMSDARKKEFAEVCYMDLAIYYDKIKEKFDLTDIVSYRYLGSSESLAYFQGKADRSPGQKYPLGDHWPFHVDRHPAAARIVETGDVIDDLDISRSTIDGKVYLYVYAPVKADGKLLCLICETLLWSDVNREIIQEAEDVETVNITVLLLALCFLLLIFYRSVIRPLVIMQETVHTYKEEKDSARVRQDLSGLKKNSNEIDILAEDISNMTEEIDRYVEEVRVQAAEKEKIGAELKLAARIQADNLPNIFPPYPDRREFELYASMSPARTVGGDFYDFSLIDEDHLMLLIADVSDKGIPAAMFMMASKSILANKALPGRSPASILEDANNTIYAGNKNDMFVTVWLGILEISTGKLVTANGGHEYPAFMKTDGEFELLKGRNGMMLGIMPGLKYTDVEISLTPGSKVFVYTDGVVEASDADNNMFGEDRMLEALNRVRTASPKEVLDEVRRSVDEFVKGAEQFDDLTMLCLEYKGK